MSRDPLQSWPAASPAKLAAVFAALAAVGAALFLGVSSASGQTEAWDSGLYWSVGVPGMAVACGIAGALVPRYFLFAGIAIVLPQAVLLFSRGFGSLWPLGMALFAVLACVGSAFALGGAFAARLGASRGPSR